MTQENTEQTKKIKGRKHNTGPWHQDEDTRLRQAISMHQTNNWADISNYVSTRTCKQCRERWHNHLNPHVKKTSFERWEDLLIIRLQKVLGNKWACMSKILEGRPDNSIKNHWNSKLKHLDLKRFYVGCSGNGCKCDLCMLIVKVLNAEIKTADLIMEMEKYINKHDSINI